MTNRISNQKYTHGASYQLECLFANSGCSSSEPRDNDSICKPLERLFGAVEGNCSPSGESPTKEQPRVYQFNPSSHRCKRQKPSGDAQSQVPETTLQRNRSTNHHQSSKKVRTKKEYKKGLDSDCLTGVNYLFNDRSAEK